jgi:site-specific recombinase XerD
MHSIEWQIKKKGIGLVPLNKPNGFPSQIIGQVPGIIDNLFVPVKRDLALKGFSESTRRNYVAHVRRFVEHFGCSPHTIGGEAIRSYLHHLLQAKGVSQSYLIQLYSALKFFYETTLCQDGSAFRIPRTKRPKKLPVVLSSTELARVFEATSNLKHRAILVTMYTGGLRLSETMHLRVADIDSDRLQIRVHQGKGAKDRSHYWLSGRWIFCGSTGR